MLVCGFLPGRIRGIIRTPANVLDGKLWNSSLELLTVKYCCKANNFIFSFFDWILLLLLMITAME